MDLCNVYKFFPSATASGSKHSWNLGTCFDHSRTEHRFLCQVGAARCEREGCLDRVGSTSSSNRQGSQVERESGITSIVQMRFLPSLSSGSGITTASRALFSLSMSVFSRWTSELISRIPSTRPNSMSFSLS